MSKSRKKKTDSSIPTEEIETAMTENQVNENVEKVDFNNRQAAEDALTGTERFQAMSKEEQSEALEKVRTLAAGKPKKVKRNPDLPGITGEGVEAPQCEEVEAASDEYVKHRDARTTALKLEVEAKKVLIAAMKSNNLQTYRYDDKMVILKPVDATESVKVTKAESDEIEIDNDEE